MKEEFKNRKEDILKIDKSLIDIEVMGVYGDRWGSNNNDIEMMLRIVYKGGKRIIKTIKGVDWYEDLLKTIYKTRAHFRSHKLERILDGD